MGKHQQIPKNANLGTLSPPNPRTIDASATKCVCGELVQRSIPHFVAHQAICRFPIVTCHQCMSIFKDRSSVIHHLTEAHSYTQPAVFRKMCRVHRPKRPKRKKKKLILEIVAEMPSSMLSFCCPFSGCRREFDSLKRLNEHKLSHWK